MGSKIIADSSALVSLGFTDDSNHHKATNSIADVNKAAANLIIPQEVFAETINVLGKKIGHREAVIFAQRILKLTTFQIVSTPQVVVEEALLKLSSLPASVSFTDCVVMATADEYETKLIFGFDECFRKSGYSMPGA